MKHNTLLVIALVTNLFGANAQESLMDFEKISIKEFESKNYSSDTSANAVVLFDLGRSYFVDTETNFDIIFERKTRIKIFNEGGLKWANIEIPYYQEGGIFENVYDIEAYVYNLENGIIKKTELKLSNVFEEKINEFWLSKKFALPEVKSGSVIEYKYKISSQYKFNLRDWNFQWKIPVLYSQYEVKMIPFYQYTWLLQGASKFHSYSTYESKGFPRNYGSLQYKEMISLYVMKDVPAFNSEEYITSINDYIINLDFQLSKIITYNGTSINIMTTWPEMIKELLKHEDFGKYVKSSIKIAPKLLNLKEMESMLPSEKFNHIMTFIKSNYSWNKNNSKYASKSTKDLLKDKFGNCADLNLLAVGLLNASGIESYPVIISTRDHGSIKGNYPYGHFFNYIIVASNIDGNTVLTDATDILCPNNRIPSRCMNDKGLKIKKGEVTWVKLNFVLPSEINTFFDINLSQNELTSNVTLTSTEYDALKYRATQGENIESIKNHLEKRGYKLRDSTLIVENQKELNNPYTLKFINDSEINVINNKYYIEPFINESNKSNPFKQKIRTYPIDFVYPYLRRFYSTINIPEGFKVDFTPENLKINNELFELIYNVQIEEKSIKVTFSYYFKNSIYSNEEYARIKHYFNEIVKKSSEKIVLVKT